MQGLSPISGLCWDLTDRKEEEYSSSNMGIREDHVGTALQAIQEAGDARMACLIEALILFPCRIRVTSSYWAAKPSHY